MGYRMFLKINKCGQSDKESVPRGLSVKISKKLNTILFLFLINRKQVKQSFTNIYFTGCLYGISPITFYNRYCKGKNKCSTVLLIKVKLEK